MSHYSPASGMLGETFPGGFPIPRGRPLTPLTLTDQEHDTLHRWIARRKTAQALALRARLILAAAEGLPNAQVEARLHLTPQTVSKWRRPFLEGGLDGLLDEPPPGAPRTITDADVERVITLALERTPQDATHWSRRAMAWRIGSQSAISRIWRAFGLQQPHRSETFKLSTDPLFIEKVRDIVSLYLNPPDQALMLCVDEQSQIQALDRTQPLLPMCPGQFERRTHGYVRHGTTSLFAAPVVKTGEVLAECRRRHRSVEFRTFLQRVEAAVSEELDVHLILDNYGTHKTPLIRRWRARPSPLLPALHANRHDVAQPGGAVLRGPHRKTAPARVHGNTRELGDAIYRYIEHQNRHPQPFIWTKTAEQILATLARFCQRISDSGYSNISPEFGCGNVLDLSV